jgi:hypothetical protein
VIEAPKALALQHYELKRLSVKCVLTFLTVLAVSGFGSDRRSGLRVRELNLVKAESGGDTAR